MRRRWVIQAFSLAVLCLALVGAAGWYALKVAALASGTRSENGSTAGTRVVPGGRFSGASYVVLVRLEHEQVEVQQRELYDVVAGRTGHLPVRLERTRLLQHVTAVQVGPRRYEVGYALWADVLALLALTAISAVLVITSWLVLRRGPIGPTGAR